MHCNGLFLNSFPKSGTNLLQKYMELSNVEYAERSIADTTLYGRNGFLRRLVNSSLPGAKVDIGLFRNTNVNKSIIRYIINNLKGKYFSGHVSYTTNLEKMLKEKNIKTILVVRQPEAILYSHYKYFINRPDIFYGKYLQNKSSQEILIRIIKGSKSSNIFPYKEALSRFCEWQRNDHFFVRFEDVIGAKGGGDNLKMENEIIRINEYLGIEVDLHSIAKNLFGGTKTFRSGQINSYQSDKGYMDFISQNEPVFSEYKHCFGYL